MLAAGWLYDRFGGAGPAFGAAALLELAPLALTLTWGRRLETATAAPALAPAPTAR
jgi:hypothetical protein